MANSGRYCFNSEPLRNAVAIGRMGPDRARLWVRSEVAGRLHLSWQSDSAEGGERSIEIPQNNDADNTAAIDLPVTGKLRSLTRYRYRVTHERGGAIGEGEFETAPASAAETPEKFSIALMSCHQPFNADGTFLEDSQAMVRAMHRCLREQNTKLLLMVGDQMYADAPPELSLFNSKHFRQVAPDGREQLQDCSADEVRRLYHQRYRLFWNMPELKTIQAEYPTCMIWDDHDIIDNWGSDPVHQTPPWAAVGEGARKACFHYQISRSIDWQEGRAFDYPIVYGNQAFYVMDLRSERRVGENGRLFSNAQQERLKAFLEEHAAKPFVHLVLSVPIVHLPRFLAEMVSRMTPNGEDFSDRWSSASHVRDRDRLLKVIHDHQVRHPKQRIMFLSGDIHIGCVHEVRWASGSSPRLFQVISSGVTHKSGPLVTFGSKAIIHLTRSIHTLDGKTAATVRFLEDENGRRGRNPCGGLNFGLLQVSSGDGGETAEIRVCLYQNRADEPVCVYRSPPLRGGRDG